MSASINGSPLLNGTAGENGQRVLYTWPTVEDFLDPDPPRASGSFAAALRYLSGYDGRTLAEIAEEAGVTRQRLGFLVTTIADKLGISTPCPGRRWPKKSSPARAEANEAAGLALITNKLVNGEGADQ